MLVQMSIAGNQGNHALGLRGKLFSIAGNNSPPLSTLLTLDQWQVFAERLAERAKTDPRLVSDVIEQLREHRAENQAIPYLNDKLTIALYEGLIDLPDFTIDEVFLTPLVRFISNTPRADEWVARIQNDIEAEVRAGTDSERLSFLGALEGELGRRAKNQPDCP